MKNPKTHKTKRLKTPKNGLADSMRIAAARLNICIDAVKLAKNMGCDAFRNSRVDCDKLAAWIKQHPEINTAPPVSKEAVEIRLKIARAAKAEKDTERSTIETERARIELDCTRKQYWSRVDVAATVEQIAQQQRLVLQRTLETELPPKIVGRDVISITEIMRTKVDEICRIFHDRTQQWL